MIHEEALIDQVDLVMRDRQHAWKERPLDLDPPSAFCSKCGCERDEPYRAVTTECTRWSLTDKQLSAVRRGEIDFTESKGFYTP
jgi:hypothetical protein